MPSRFVVRNLKENSTYHIYNRSLTGEPLFRDAQDYRVFLFYIYIYVTPNEEVSNKFSDLPMRLRQKTLVSQLDLICYSLLPDHFHLVIRQLRKGAMPKLMRQLGNGYTTYFNKKYNKRGPVFSGRYKAVEITDETLVDLVRYIHLEPKSKNLTAELKDYEWSSYRKYVGEEVFLSCDTGIVTSKLGSVEKFLEFHINQEDFRRSLPRIAKVTID